MTVTEAAPLNVAIATIDGPVWLKPSSAGTELFTTKLDAPVINVLGFSAEVPSKSQHVQLQIADGPGRTRRALPLFLAEHLWSNSRARVQTLAPWVTGKSVGFVLSGVPWRDENAAKYSLQGLIKSDFVIIVHLKSQSEPWTTESRLTRSSNCESLGEFSASFQSANPESVLDLAW